MSAGQTAILEFLGTGTSTGIPVAACPCPVCRSPDPHDKRLRSSALVRGPDGALVIDTGPEFRLQCLRAGLTDLDAVLLTHHHVDHFFGLDDVRPFSSFRGRTLPVWGSRRTLEAIRHYYDYIWNAEQIGGGLPDIAPRLAAGPFTAAGMEVTPLPIMHGILPILGFRIGDLAYMSDISMLPEETFPLLNNLGTMIVSCVRHRAHRTHLDIVGAKRLHNRVRPARTLVTHVSHYFSHKELVALLPRDMNPAHDGMRVEIRL